ncbi:MAG: hypothetical protein ACRCV9_00885 [Burkholderiaceae bacterium]
MNRLAALLVFLVLGRYFIMDGVPAGIFSAPQIEYIKGGVFAAALCAIVLFAIVLPQPGSAARFIAALCCVIGIIESLMLSACMAGWRLIGKQPWDLPAGVPMCPALTGVPVRELAFTLYFIVLLWGVAKWRRAARPT